MSTNRREFMKNAGTMMFVAPLAPSLLLHQKQSEGPLNVHLFSKHLQFLDIKTASQMAAEMGFAGLDLTVRPKGHILPENAEKDLFTAIQDIKKAGSACEMITTAIDDVDSKYDVKIIEAAAKSGVQFYRSNWFKYHKDKTLQESIKSYQKKVKALGKVNKKNNIIGCYQNHAGTKIGASCWEVKQLLDEANPAYFGTQYDIRHAVAEGGLSWRNGLKLLRPHIKTIVLKDFKWKQSKGSLKIENVPIGEGVVDFTSYFKLLKSYGLQPPVSLHCEYPLGGAEKGRYEITVDKNVVFTAMKKDLIAIQKLWKEA